MKKEEPSIGEQLKEKEEESPKKKECEESLNGEVKRSEEGITYCEFSMSEILEDEKICLDENYVLQGDTCVKELRLPAKIRYVCPDGYYFDGTNCNEK